MNQTILGEFKNRIDVESAIGALDAVGFKPDEISIVMKDGKQEAGEVGGDMASEVSEGVVSGAASGGIIGGFAGFLAGTVLPGIGGFFIAGPIGAVLGLTGVAAATVTGVVAGAVTGGLAGALTGFGLSFEEAKVYESRVENGSILVLVPVTDGQSGGVIDIFTQYHVADTKILSKQEEPSQQLRDAVIGNDETEKSIYDKPDENAYNSYMGMKGGNADKDTDLEE